MSEPYVGEIRLFTYTRGAPNGWLQCNGSLLPVANYEVLFSLLGTNYGGDGNVTFGLPDLRGRVPIHQGQGNGLSAYVIGQSGGSETVTLTSQQLASHAHAVLASTAPATSADPSNAVTAAGIVGDPFYAPGPAPSSQNFAPTTLSQTGGNQPHENCAPSLALMFCIAFEGIYPQQQ